MAATPLVLVVMGVSGSGKTTVGRALAERLGWPFQEGDDLHPASNVAKMAAGQPLTDEDRAPWLARVADWVDAHRGVGGVITCSALKRAYRDELDRSGSGVEFVYLRGSRTLIADRLEHRHGHYMPPSLLGSQLETLEEPSADEPAITIDAGPSPEVLVDEIVAALGV